MRTAAICSFLLWLSIAAGAGRAGEQAFDVVVYGATPGGITAAVAAARQGASVALIEPSRHIGGMTSGGLSATDYGNPTYVGGLALKFFDQAAAKYRSAPAKLAGLGRNARWFSEPHVAEQTFLDMVKRPGITLATERPLQSVTSRKHRITSLRTADGTVYRGRVFIDATYEGDLMAQAGVKYAVGRESRDTYGESLAGFCPPKLRPRTVAFMATKGSSYVHGTPAELLARRPDGTLLWGIRDIAWPEPGAGDRLVQSYNFRVIATQRKDILIPFPKPKHYDPARYELLLEMVRAFPGVRFERLVFTGAIPNGKYDVNASGLIVSTDHPGFNTEYPDGNETTRRRIWQDHVDWVQGIFYFLGHDGRVPRALRDQVNEWGLCKDEFADNDHWPYALYVREARRMIGAYVMRQCDCQENRTKSDSVAMGTFILDCHCLQRLVTPEGLAVDEGNFDVPVRPYQIAYRSITPLAAECENLLVPVCLSASHVAYGSIRMEPQYMMLGQAAGLAAVMAIEQKAAVQRIDLAKLQRTLRGQGQILTDADRRK
jgi:hypothetical protein